MSFSFGGKKEKSRQEENTTQTYTPNAQFLNQTNQGLDRALGLMGTFRPTDGADVQRYLNPMLDDVVGGVQRDLRRTRDITGNSLDGQAAAAGAFGGSGWGLLRGENNRAFADAEADAVSGIRAGGYDRALAAAMGENDASRGYDLAALQTYLQGLGLLGNWGTTTGNGLRKGEGSGMQFGASFKYGGGGG